MRGYAEPKAKQGSIAEDRAIPASPSEEFVFMWRQEQWYAVEYAPLRKDGKRGKPRLTWLPRFSQVPLTRGANGITGDAGTRDPSAYIGKVQRDGGIVFTKGDRRLGPYKDFVFEVPCQKGQRRGTRHITPWEKPVVLGSRTQWQLDQPGYFDMLYYVLEHGVVEPMSEFVLMVELERQDDRIARAQQRAEMTPAMERRYQAEVAKRKAMVDAYNRQFGGAAVEPEVEADDA